MSVAPRCWGIYRELAHSPNRENDDAEILRATAGRLAQMGFDVELKSPEELPSSEDAAGIAPFLFVMCMREEIVGRLAAWERQGVRVVNRPEAIRNTDRDRTLARVLGDGIPFPESVLVSTAPDREESSISLPCWVKRGKYHSTHREDVALARTPEELARRLEALAARGIDRAVLQRHVPGDLIKFYGVAGVEGSGRRCRGFSGSTTATKRCPTTRLIPAICRPPSRTPRRLSASRSSEATRSRPETGGSS